MDSNKIRKESWDLVRDTIFNNVADPASRGIPNWINSSFPDIKNADFPGYPLIIISSPNLDWMYKTFGESKRESEIPFLISIFSRTSLEMSELADSIDSELRLNNSIFKENNLNNMRIRDFPDRIVKDGKKKIHQKQFVVRFDYFGD